MKTKIAREIALLCVPILIIGGVALWNGKVKSWSGFGAPRGLFEGKPRLEITNWKRETPSALDFARGISSRWTVTTWGGGVCSADEKPSFQRGMEYPKHLYFAWKRGGKWHQTAFLYGPTELDVMNFGVREKPTKYEVKLGLPMDLVPKDAEEVRLRGYMEGWMVCEPTDIRFPSAPIDVALQAPRQMRPTFTGPRVSPLTFVGAKQSWYSQKIKGVTTNSVWQIESGFSYSGKSEQDTIKAARTWVEDATGQWVLDIGTSSWGPYPDDGKFQMGDTSNPIWGVDTTKLKGHQGPFTLKSWVYVDPNEWPLRVSIPLKIGKP